ncbi:unnamed protein product, partial [Echinostoma caproni]|uniref:DCB domain-containing protein n=1 Tax=Echinostoma caproni TaxID=27848 RepID=A0A183AN80_9TREM
MDSDTGFLKALSTLKAATIQVERKDLCHLLEESYALMKRWNSSHLRLWVLRDKVFEPIQLAVESNDPRLCTPAVHCLQAFLHDDRFKSCTEFSSDPRWIPCQVLHTLCACNSFEENGQIEVLKILLDIVLSNQWSLSVNLLIKLVELCLRMSDNFSTPCDATLPRMVSSTLNQILESVVLTYKRCEPETFDSLVCNSTYRCCSPLPDLVLRSELPISSTTTSAAAGTEIPPPVERDGGEALRHDLLTVFEHLVRCLSLSTPVDDRSGSNPTCFKSGRVQTVLSAVLTMLMHLPTGIVRFRAFTDVVWQSLCPSLIALMQANSADGSPYKKLTGTVDSPEFGRGSGVESSNGLPIHPDICHIVHGITTRLAHMLGPLIEMRPVLESLFHSVLLYPPPRQRLTALKMMQPLLSSERELMRITLPCWHLVESSTETSRSTHEFTPVSDWAAIDQSTGAIPVPMRLIRILLDSLAECSCSGDGTLAQCSMDCMASLFSTLERLAVGSSLEPWLSALLVPQLVQLTKAVCERYRSQANTAESSCFGPPSAIFNADAIYVMSYATLALNWRLCLHGFYNTSQGSLKLTDQDEQSFIDSIINRNLLVYLPVSFISEVYCLVTRTNYLRSAELDVDKVLSNPTTTTDGPTGAVDIPGSVLCATLNAFNGVREDLQDRHDHRAFLIDQSPSLVGSRLVRFFLGPIWNPFLWSVAGVFCTPGLFGPRTRLQIVQLGHCAQLELHTLPHWTRLLPQSGMTENRLATGQAVLAAIHQ